MNSKIIASLAAGLVSAACSLSVFSAPDLSGTYNVATLTPLERPRAFGKNLYLSIEDAEKMRAADAAAKAERNEASDPNREAPPCTFNPAVSCHGSNRGRGQRSSSGYHISSEQ